VSTSGLALILAASAPFAAAQPAGERSLADLARAYRSGHHESAVLAATLLPREAVESEVDRIATLFTRSGLAGNRERQGAVALLTEAALQDLQDGASERGRWELQSAERLVRIGPAATRGGEFDRVFYLLAGTALQWAGDLETSHDVLERGLRAAGDDPELQTAIGVVIETVAALRQYDPSPDSGRRRTQHGGYATETGGAGSLGIATPSLAADRYERALSLDPRLVEARLRLGRVRLLQGRLDQALRELEPVAAQAGDPRLRYLARLFQGRVLEALADFEGSAAAFRAAADIVPGAQSALIALARALDRLGDPGAAQAALEGASRSGGPEDPWWDYLSGQPRRLAPWRDELRSLVR
jgi:tetratricopeptide (TPR) repeat protein